MILLADPVKKRKPLLWHRGKLNSMSLNFSGRNAQCALIVTCRNIGRKPKSVLLRHARQIGTRMLWLNSFPLAVNFELIESFWRHSWCLYQAFCFIVSFLPFEWFWCVICLCSNLFSILVCSSCVSVLPNLALGAEHLRTRESGSMGTRNSFHRPAFVGPEIV